ncbi:hypothetical protein, partial [Succinimonas amylolytica]|uniref:hypothetical protein n=1 Tax=Succinimonas amylolytica TaxID=83769 RepID=UPI001B7FEFAF
CVYSLTPVLYQHFINAKKRTGFTGKSTSVFDRITFQISLPWMASKFFLSPPGHFSNAWAGSKAL